MSVKIQKRADDEKVAEDIWIADELPDISELLSFTTIECISIKGISDGQKIQAFLEELPMNTIKKLNILECNMEDFDIRLFGRLQLIEKICIIENSGVNYDELLKIIPNGENIKQILLVDNNERNSITLELFNRFKKLKNLGLRGFFEMDMSELNSYLIGAKNLESIVLQSDFKNLDFISGLSSALRIVLMDKDFDLDLLTPEVVNNYENFMYSSEGEKIIIKRVDDTNVKEVRVTIQYERIERLKKWLEEIGCDKVDGIIGINSKRELQDLIRNGNPLQKTDIRVPHMGIIDFEELEQCDSLNNVIVMEQENDENEENYKYTIVQYSRLKNKIQEIIGDIPKGLTDLQKFMIIYKRLGSTISYDYKLLEEEEREEKEQGYKSKYVKKNKWRGRNLVNGLIKGKCVCAGYSDILYNCLKEIGIEACKISNDKHAWNKVQLDGVWYNVDLTWDCDAVVKHNAKGLINCLRSDEEFEEKHIQKKGKQVKCDIDYPREEVEKAFKFAEEFMRQSIDAEYEQIEEKPNFFDRLKARAMTLFGIRKMIEAPKDVAKASTTAERRENWLKKGSIVLDNGTEVSTINPVEASREKGQEKIEKLMINIEKE